MTEILKAGITAAKQGDHASARILLLEATKINPRQQTAWLWLASLADSPESTVEHLRQAGAINPDNQHTAA